MKKTIRLTESDLRKIIKEALNELDNVNDIVVDYNRYGFRLPNTTFNDNPDKPSDWDKPTSWKLREPEVDSSDYYGSTPQSIQKMRNSHLALHTGHPINYNSSDVNDKIESDRQLFDPDKSSHDFTFDDGNSTFIRPSHWMVGDDEIWKGVNEPKTSKKATFDSADKRLLHRKGSGNRELIAMDTQKKLDESIRRAIHKYLC